MQNSSKYVTSGQSAALLSGNRRTPASAVNAILNWSLCWSVGGSAQGRLPVDVLVLNIGTNQSIQWRWRERYVSRILSSIGTQPGDWPRDGELGFWGCAGTLSAPKPTLSDCQRSNVGPLKPIVCKHAVFLMNIKRRLAILTRALLGGGVFEHPHCRFVEVAKKKWRRRALATVIEEQLWNFHDGIMSSVPTKRISRNFCLMTWGSGWNLVTIPKYDLGTFW